MSLVDLKNRWIYKGSLTVPPCRKAVYWNVLHTVYPIKKAHLELLKAKIAAGGKAPNGNWRAIQPRMTDPGTGHKVSIVTETTFGSERDTANDVNYNINVNIYNQNVGGECK